VVVCVSESQHASRTGLGFGDGKLRAPRARLLTKGGPHGTLPEFTIPNGGMEANPTGLLIFVDYQRMLEAVVNDLTAARQQNRIRSSLHTHTYA